MQQPRNPYDFVLNSGGEPGKSFLSGSKNKRIAVTIAFLAILLIVFGILFSFIFGGNDKLAQQTLKLAQTHHELIRVAEIGSNKARLNSTRNLATTSKLTLESYTDKITEIAKKNQKVTNSLLSSGKNTETDEALERAEQNNRFDETFSEIFLQELSDFKSQVSQVRDSVTSSSDKQELDRLNQQIEKLLPDSQ